VNRDRTRILALLRGGGRFLLTSHVNPDGDSVASQCAMRLLIESFGGSADIVNSHAVPRNYRFLPGTSRFGIRPPKTWKPYRAAIVLDCGDARRASGLLEPRPPIPVVNIDHHATNPGYGDLNCVVPDACSTAEIIYGLAVSLGVRPAGGLAEALYTGILTDTGSFATATRRRARFGSPASWSTPASTRRASHKPSTNRFPTRPSRFSVRRSPACGAPRTGASPGFACPPRFSGDWRPPRRARNGPAIRGRSTRP
jgi:nanoRNase/pAp phosphatase (c-di-AMP/oligoRNAs hydrolase)